MGTAPTKTAAQTQIQVQDPFDRFHKKIQPGGQAGRQIGTALQKQKQEWDRKRREKAWRQHFQNMYGKQQRGTLAPTSPAASPAPQAAPQAAFKPMQAPTTKITPSILSLFNGDKDEVLDFIDSLNKQELRIMERNCDNPDVIKRLKVRVRSDIEETSKDLAMEN